MIHLCLICLLELRRIVNCLFNVPLSIDNEDKEVIHVIIQLIHGVE